MTPRGKPQGITTDHSPTRYLLTAATEAAPGIRLARRVGAASSSDRSRLDTGTRRTLATAPLEAEAPKHTFNGRPQPIEMRAHERSTAHECVPERHTVSFASAPRKTSAPRTTLGDPRPLPVVAQASPRVGSGRRTLIPDRDTRLICIDIVVAARTLTRPGEPPRPRRRVVATAARHRSATLSVQCCGLDRRPPATDPKVAHGADYQVLIRARTNNRSPSADRNASVAPPQQGANGTSHEVSAPYDEISAVIVHASLPSWHLPPSGFLTLSTVFSHRHLVALFQTTSVHRL
jgi:hypothetical protein